MRNILPDSIPLAVVTRSGVSDTLHRGSVVVVDESGSVLYEAGDRRTLAYIRSAAKPVQCIPVITGGAADAFGFSDDDIAIACGSHRGGPEQVAQVRGMLRKCGLDEGQLTCGSGIDDNCSGKHAAMLAACKHQGLPLEDYVNATHPHQRAVLRVLAAVCDLAETEFHIGIDGCSAPIHYLRLEMMARGFARLSRADKHFDGPTASAVERITRAMWAAPDGHTGEPLYRDVLGEAPRLLTKIGGCGVYCAAVVGQGVGFAMKVDDGNSIAIHPVFAEVMRRVGVLSDAEAAEITARFSRPVDNRRGQIVGDIQLLI